VREELTAITSAHDVGDGDAFAAEYLTTVFSR
jgi:hypothetical protein